MNRATHPDELTKAGRRALERASNRPRGNVCPTGCRGASEQPMLERLYAAGYITDLRAPYITDAGRAALALSHKSQERES